MFETLPGGHDAPVSMQTRAQQPAPQEPLQQADPHSALPVLPAVLKTVIILSSKRHNRHLCVNADRSPPRGSHFNVGVTNQIRFKKQNVSGLIADSACSGKSHK